jgi:hypothetical protein
MNFLKNLSPLRRRKKKVKEEEEKEGKKKKKRAATLGAIGSKYFRKRVGEKQSGKRDSSSLSPSYILSSDSMAGKSSSKQGGFREKEEKKKYMSRRDSKPPVEPPPSPPSPLRRLNTQDIFVSNSESELMSYSESIVNWLEDSSKKLPSWKLSGKKKEKSSSKKSSFSSSNSGRLRTPGTRKARVKKLRKRVSVDTSIIPSPQALEFSKNIINDAYVIFFLLLLLPYSCNVSLPYLVFVSYVYPFTQVRKIEFVIV